MIQPAVIAKNVSQLVVDNSPAIMTAFGVVGVVTTAVLTGKASVAASNKIRTEEVARTTEAFNGDFAYEKMSVKEKAKLSWTLYIPAATTGALTIASILGANNVSSKRNAALISAYSLSEKAFTEYREKVVEQIGVNKETKVRDEIAQDRVTANPISNNEVFITGNGDHLCYETMTGRYFKSTVEAIRKAQNDINAQIINEGYASQNEFCALLGLPSTGYGEQVGWSGDGLLDVQFSAVLSEDGVPCMAVGYQFKPRENYYKINR